MGRRVQLCVVLVRAAMGDAWGENPFDNGGADANPFEDESVTSATSTPRESSSSSKKDKKKKKKEKKSKASNNDSFADAQDRFAASVANDSDLQAREAALREREAQLHDRERSAADIVRRNTPNYPPIPKCLCFKPWVFHDISIDIVPTWRAMQRACFIHFHVFVIILFFNMIVCGIQLTVPHRIVGRAEGPVVSFIVSIAYFCF